MYGRSTLVSASTRCGSQTCPGQNQFHPGPRKNVPIIMNETHKMWNPIKNARISNDRSFSVKYPLPFGLISRYGINISPTIINVGSTTPAYHGSKNTSISCKPRKYHGAFDGFGVRVGFDGCSSGAFSSSDHTVKTMMTSSDMRNSLRTRNGQVCSFSSTPPPAFLIGTSMRLPPDAGGVLAAPAPAPAARITMPPSLPSGLAMINPLVRRSVFVVGPPRRRREHVHYIQQDRHCDWHRQNAHNSLVQKPRKYVSHPQPRPRAAPTCRRGGFARSALP